MRIKETQAPHLLDILDSTRSILLYGYNKALQTFYMEIIIKWWSKRGPIIYEENITSCLNLIRNNGSSLFGYEPRLAIISHTNEKTLDEIKLSLELTSIHSVLLSTTLRRSSQLVSYLDKHKNGLTIPCYEFNQHILPLANHLVSDQLRTCNVKFSKTELEFLVSQAQTNLRSFWSDIDKICCCFYNKKISIQNIEKLLTTDDETPLLEKTFLTGSNTDLDSAVRSYLTQGVTETTILQKLISKLFLLLSLQTQEQENRHARLWIPPKSLELYRNAIKKFTKKRIIKMIVMLRQAEKMQKTAPTRTQSLLLYSLLTARSSRSDLHDSFS